MGSRTDNGPPRKRHKKKDEMQASIRNRLRGWGVTVLRAVVSLIFLAHGAISRCYNLLITVVMFGNHFPDAQCGFKAIKRSVAQKLLPQVADGEWFFDTELLLLAEERGYRISEVPVAWIEDLDSRVDVASTVMKDVKGPLRVRVERMRPRLSRHRSRDALDAAHRARSWRLIAEATAAVEARESSER